MNPKALRSFRNSYFIAALALATGGCTPSPKDLGALLEKHPEIITNAIDKNPERFTETFQKMSAAAQAKAQAQAAEEESKKFEAEFQNPLKPSIAPERASMGNPQAKITIVEYTDFQCPYCSRGYATLEEVRKTYGDKVRVIVKNLPLPMHPLAVPAAARFEALMLQSPEKAFAYYHEVFANQGKLGTDGEKFLDATVKKVGGNVAKVKKDMDSDAVRATIAADSAEAASFGIQGTPGFIVEGVSIRGAYPIDTFKKIIDRKLAANP